MSVPAWKLRLQMQGKEGAPANSSNQGSNGQKDEAPLPRELQVNKRAQEATKSTNAKSGDNNIGAGQPTETSEMQQKESAVKNTEGSEYSGPKEQEKAQFAYRAPEDNIKKSFEPKKWEKTGFQGAAPMDFFVRQNNEKKKVREKERQAAARIYKHNTYDKSLFE